MAYRSNDLLEDAHLPDPSYQPVLLALGVLLMAFGVVTTLVLSAVGLILVLAAIVGWAAENRLETPHEDITHG